MRRNVIVWVLSALMAGLTGVVTTPGSAAAAPPGFNDTVFASGVGFTTAMALAPDGRLFVAQRSGSLLVVRPDGSVAPAPFVHLDVDAQGERGLLGVALHPDFARNGYVYVYWTVAGTPPHNRISRLTAAGDVAAGSPTTLVDLEGLGPTNHNGGAMRFGPDGKLYVAVGENATGANAQTLANRLGKMLRYNDDGTIPTDNPFYAQASGDNRAIYALGFRNPFTFAFGPAGVALVNDVGQSTWEEIDRLEPGANYGWPQGEGVKGAGFRPPGPGPYRDPVYVYGHAGGGCAITGAAFYTSTQFPAEYQGDYFFGDYCAGWVKRLRDPASTFLASVGFVPDLVTRPDGSMLYLAAEQGTVRRITYGAQVAPSITQPPADVVYAPGQPVTFSVQASGSQPLLFQWQQLVAGTWVDVAGATGRTLTLPTQPGVALPPVRVVVSNSAGTATSPAARAIPAASQVTITSPAPGTRYRVGDPLRVQGRATDAAGTPLPMEWRVEFHHDAHTHPTRDWTAFDGDEPFTVPDQAGHDPGAGTYWFRIEVRARQAGGALVTTARDIFPVGATDHFEPGAPVRLVDTREARGGLRLAAGATLAVPVRELASVVPDAASAVAVNLTATGASADGYLTAWPCDQPRPATSTLNYTAGTAVAAGALIGLGGGRLCISSWAATDVVVDLNGWADPYPTTTAALVPLAPVRVDDTRPAGGRPVPAGGTRVVPVTSRTALPAGTRAVVVNLTATQASTAGFVTVWPCDQARPNVSNLNVAAGQTRANLVTVALGADGTLCEYSYGATHLVTDVTGAYVVGAPGDIEPVAPRRMLDTRGGSAVPAGGTVAVVAPPGARAVALSVVATQPLGPGYLTVYPCGGVVPGSSTLNYTPGASVANGAVSAVGASGRVCITTYAATHIVVDLTALFT